MKDDSLKGVASLMWIVAGLFMFEVLLVPKFAVYMGLTDIYVQFFFMTAAFGFVWFGLASMSVAIKKGVFG